MTQEISKNYINFLSFPVLKMILSYPHPPCFKQNFSLLSITLIIQIFTPLKK